MLDYLAIYSRILTEEEILEVMEKGHAAEFAVHSMDKIVTAWDKLKR